MILFGKTPFRPDILSRMRDCPACRWRMLPRVAMAAALAPLPASGCEGGFGCADQIDAFFLPLIANSLRDSPQTMAGATMPVTTPDTKLPTEPVVIRPPPRPPSDAATFMPALRIRMAQRLVAGEATKSGRADLTVDHSSMRIPVSGGTGTMMTEPAPVIPTLRQDGGAVGVWHMQHTVVLPMHAAWPVGRLQQPVTMQLACGACGRDGGIAHFNGSAQFEIEFDLFAEGWIEEIDLTSAGGLTANGHISFWDDQPLRHLAVDHKAVMVLRIDGRRGDLGGSLATWFGADKRVAGIFTATQIGDAAGFGAIAGQFRGAPCTPPCGVEN